MNKTKSSVKLKTKESSFIHELIKNKYLYIMAIPGLLYFLIFCYVPLYGTIIAFKDYAPALGVFKSPWVGLANFIKFFNSPNFKGILTNTITLSLYGLALGFPIPIIFALMLNELRLKRYKSFVQTVTYIPHFISMVVVCGMIVNFSMKDGLFNAVLSCFGVPAENLLLKPNLFKTIYVFSSVWQETGWDSIIYLAALTGIDSALYEAADVDGAGRWKKMFNITLPGIAPTIMIILILRIGNIMNVGYEKVILLYNSITRDSADVISSFVYRKGIIDYDYSYATAAGLFNSLVNVIVLTLANLLSRKLSDSSLW